MITVYLPDNTLNPADRSSMITSCGSCSSGMLFTCGHQPVFLRASKMPRKYAALLSKRLMSTRSVVVRGHGTYSGHMQQI